MFNNWISEDNRLFLFAKHRLLGLFFTLHPMLVFFGLSIACSLLLFFPAKVLHLSSVPVHFNHAAGPPPCATWDNSTPASDTHDVGILHKWNWSLGYSLVVPLIFALAAIACRSVRQSFCQLVEEGTVQPDVCDQSAGKSSDFVRMIAERLRSWDEPVFIASLAIALVVGLWDAHKNLVVYTKVFFSGSPLEHWHAACQWDDIDWMHAWTITGQARDWPHVISNFLFYLVAEAIQGLVVFLACYFVLKFLSITQTLASVLIEKGSGFHFEPFISDPEKCLGLRPIGRIFSMFLLLSIVFQVFAFGLRVRAILINQNQSVFDYFKDIATQIKALTQAVDQPAVEKATGLLIHAAGFNTGDLNSGLIAILILMAVPMSVIAWWPIIRLRNHVLTIRQKQLREFRLAEQQARKDNKFDSAKHISDDMAKLTKSSIWPNGFRVGWGSFFFLFALLVSTIVPPLIVPLASGGIGLKLFNKIMSD